MVRNCAPENLEIPGSVLSDRPGMTNIKAPPARYYNSREIGMAACRNVHVRTRSKR
jgi:hypothetical protein